MKLGQLYRCGHLLTILLVLGLSACGPITALTTVRDATVALEAAKVAGAEKQAPYEFTSAEQYLAKAREEQGYADYQIAVDLAKKALEFAVKAKKLAMAQGKESRDTITPSADPRGEPPAPIRQPIPVPSRAMPQPAGGR
jgi:hypothetical protein